MTAARKRGLVIWEGLLLFGTPGGSRGAATRAPHPRWRRLTPRARAAPAAAPPRPRACTVPRSFQRSGSISSDTARSRSNCSASSRREAPALHAQRDLVVQLERAVVEVHRADRRPGAVDARASWRAASSAGTRRSARRRLEQLLVGCAAPAVRTNPLSMCGPGTRTRTCDAAVGRVAQRLDERRARHEVRGGQLDRLARGGDREEVERLDVRVADAGARSARAASAPPPSTGSSVGQVVRRRRAPRRSPRASSRRTRPAARGRPGPRTRTWVSRQWSGSCGVARPLLRDPDAAGHPDLPVGDQQLAVGAVVRAAGSRRAWAGGSARRSRPRRASRSIRSRSICTAPSASRITLTRRRRAPCRRARRRPRRRCRRASRRRSGRLTSTRACGCLEEGGEDRGRR